MTDGPTDSGTPGVPEHGKKKRAVVEPTPPARAMSIHAHPDDQEFTVGGTLAKWARAGQPSSRSASRAAPAARIASPLLT